MKTKIQTLVHSNIFDYFITSIIFTNAILIGVEISFRSEVISNIQSSCLAIFIIEIALRWIGKNSLSEYLKNGWNWYDIIIVLISLIPESIFTDAEVISALRILRVFRIFRIFKAIPSMGLMARVLIGSLKSLFQATFFLIIFMYLYSIIGVILFKGETCVINHSKEIIDPYGSIGEAFFSLFRITTGEDWTDLRYNLMKNNESNIIVNIYHISWMVLSAFLLLNIIVGAIVNNYEEESNKTSIKETEDKIEILLKKLNSIEKKLMEN